MEGIVLVVSRKAWCCRQKGLRLSYFDYNQGGHYVDQEEDRTECASLGDPRHDADGGRRSDLK